MGVPSELNCEKSRGFAKYYDNWIEIQLYNMGVPLELNCEKRYVFGKYCNHWIKCISII